MAFDSFLKLDGVTGESTAQGHANEIDLVSFSWGETQLGGRPAGKAIGGGGGAGKVSMQDFHFSMRTNKATPQLAGFVASGRHIATAVLTCRRPSEEEGSFQAFLVITLNDCLVSSYQIGSNGQDTGLYSPLETDDDRPLDQFSLNFARISVQYIAQSPTGGVDDTTTFDAGT